MIQIENIAHQYEVRENTSWRSQSKRIVDALCGITFQVNKGELFGILGPNGAGKTTLFRILVTLLIPTSGRAVICGFDVVEQAHQIRSLIGFTFGGDTGLYPRISARDNLIYFGNLYHMDGKLLRQRVEEILDKVNLTTRANDPVSSFSRGMKQRLHIARALLHGPRILILDEPTMGLDPTIANEIRLTIRGLAESGITILLSTHYMLEANQLCNRVAIINHGKLIALDHPDNLRIRENNTAVIDIRLSNALPEQIMNLKSIPDVKILTETDAPPYKLLSIQTNKIDEVTLIIKTIFTDEINMAVREPTLEEAYLSLIQTKTKTL